VPKADKTLRVPLSPGQILRLGAWFSLLTYLVDLCARGVQRLRPVEMPGVNVDVAWMALLADLLVFAAPALTLALAARCWRPLVFLRIACFMFAIPLFATLVLAVTGLARYSVVLLALGCAAEAARQLAARPRGLLALVGRTWGWLLALSAGLAAGATVCLHAAHYRAPRKFGTLRLPMPPMSCS
jgi:hypothetical protein